MKYLRTQAARLEEIVNDFVCNMNARGFEIKVNNGRVFGRKIKNREKKINGVRADYSAEFFMLIDDFIIHKSTNKIVDVVRR
ncbi:hypothetical protein CPIN18021_1074 [Campylobacter pinnipediorum subsp. caledonicus]|uniref:Uncharacterized protein n=1 Tax=Campylobacter pinnipediorum subsp. caledonicus TaxID=1874362 RepID=A0A1S6U828_9BACT|nr:hypothetical protein [Campylobacter pinnipediorum]AQW85458.1 hypothetical protein CPIN18020_0211 [Campylobacter pinnipediorum subsp. caledonicus]AQW87873.1 hypothetical protein CPIN18021_1074 [Campylobacter pinnipediorum subsp. caledonicus]